MEEAVEEAVRRVRGHGADPPAYTVTGSLPVEDTACSMAAAAPAPTPASVTLLASPPKALMFFWTHERASLSSLRPRLPGAAASPVVRKPGAEAERSGRVTGWARHGE